MDSNFVENDFIQRYDRAVKTAEYIIANRCTVRDAAKALGISKSTVHKDVTEKLAEFNPGLYNEVREILEKNKSERHLRGGLATKCKYLAIKLIKNETS